MVGIIAKLFTLNTRLYLPAYATCCGGSGIDIFQLPPRLIHALRFWQAHYALLSRERAPAAIYALMEGLVSLVVYVNCVSTLVHRWRWRWIGFGNASAILGRH